MTYIFTEKVRKNITLLVIHCAPLKVTLCKLWHQLLMSHLICPSIDKALIAWNETLLPTGYQSPSLGACSRSMCPEPCCWGEDHPLPWSVEAGCPVLVQSTGAPTPAPSQPGWLCPFPWGRVNHHVGASILTPLHLSLKFTAYSRGICWGQIQDFQPGWRTELKDQSLWLAGKQGVV